MVDEVHDGDTIRDTDIVFDCPYCGKSLAIDYHGAGLNIECTDCGQEVIVPIPDGMELTDIDSSPEDQEVRILNLRKALTDSEVRIAELEARIEAMTVQRKELEEGQGAAQSLVETARLKVEEIRSLQSGIHDALDEIAALIT